MATSWTDGASAKQAFLNDGYYQDEAQRQAAMKYTYDQLQGGNVNADPWALTSATYATENPNDPGVVAQQQKAQQSLQDWMTRGGGMAGMGGTPNTMSRDALIAKMRAVNQARAQQRMGQPLYHQYGSYGSLNGGFGGIDLQRLMQQLYNMKRMGYWGGNSGQAPTLQANQPNFSLGQYMTQGAPSGNFGQQNQQVPNIMGIYGNQ